MRSKNISRRVLRFLLSYSKSANVGWSINYLPEHSEILYATMPRLVQSIPRSAVYVELTEKSSGRLRLNLKAGADRSQYDHALEDLFRGMNIQQRYRDQLAQAMTPRSFVKTVLENDQKALESEGGLTNTASTKVVEGIPSNDELLRQLLSIPYRSMPEDVPGILYQKEDANYYPCVDVQRLCPPKWSGKMSI